MKNIVFILLLCPFFSFAQDNFNLPLNKAGTDIVYSQNFTIDSPELHFNKIVGLINKISSANDFRNITIDSNAMIILVNGTRIFKNINTSEYTFELDYVLGISLKTGLVQISNIYHKNKNEDREDLGHCFAFKDKTFKAKYYDVINTMQIFMPLKLDEFKRQIDSSLLGLVNTESLAKNTHFKTISIDKTLTKDDYILKASEAMNNFYKQKSASHLLSVSGLSIGLISLALSNNTTGQTSLRKPLAIIGGGLMLIGGIVNIDSYKYIKESSMYLKKSVDGIGLGIRF